MAAIDNDYRGDDKSNCSVCKEDYQDPRSLDCGHHFCRRCLEGILREDPEGSIKCPECRLETKVKPGSGAKGLKRPLLETLEERAGRFLKNTNTKSVEVNRPCDTCKEENTQAINFCYQCTKNLCQSCHEIHERKAPYHRCVPVTNPVFCKDHDEEIPVHYCEDCNRGICSLCLFGDHVDHQTADIGDVASKCRQRLNEFITLNKTSFAQKGNKLLQRIGSRLQDARELDTFFKEEVAKAKRLLSEFEEKLGQVQEEITIKTLELYESDTKDLLKSSQILVDNATHLTQRESDPELVEKARGFPMVDVGSLERIQNASVELPVLDKLLLPICSKLQGLIVDCKVECGKTKIGDLIKQHTLSIPYAVRGLAVDIKRQRFIARTQDPQAPIMVFTYGGQMVETIGSGVPGLGECSSKDGWGTIKYCTGIALDTKRDLYLAPCKGSLALIDRAGTLVRSVNCFKDSGVAYCQDTDTYLLSGEGVAKVDPVTAKVINLCIDTNMFSNRSSCIENILQGIVAGIASPCIFVSDYNEKCIKLISTSGGDVKSYCSKDKKNDQVKGPRGICIDSMGRVLVCDQGNKRIMAFSIDSAGEERWQCLLSDDWGGHGPHHLALDTDNIVMAVIDDTLKTMHIYQ